MMNKFSLADWIRGNCKFAAEEDELAKSPAKWGVVYAGPNPDGSRKKCDNCFMYVKDKNQCIIHSKGEYVSDTHVCGYHVYGKPLTAWLDQGIKPLDPKTSGLVKTEDGTSCDNCKRFEHGYCYAIAGRDDSNGPEPVDPKGCCARWTKK